MPSQPPPSTSRRVPLSLPLPKGPCRVRVWRREYFRLQSTFPQSEARPTHAPSDHEILHRLDEGFDVPDRVSAPSPREVIQCVLDVLKID